MSQTVTLPHRWRKAWQRYISPRADPETVIGWWERRRGRYNFILILWLAVNLLVWLLASGLTLSYKLLVHHDGIFLPSWLGDGMICIICGIILQMTANLWYTGGWMADLLWTAVGRGKGRWFSPCALLIGTIFSLLFAECFYWTMLKDSLY